MVRDDYGTGAILPRIAGTDYRAESALRADSGTMKAFRQIVEKVDMNEVNVWKGDPSAVDTVEGSLASGIPLEDPEEMQRV